MKKFLIVLCLSFAGSALAAEGPWWKGNLHTHTLWSDGDNYPEVIAKWYKNRGWHFLSLTDHNRLQVGERWIDVMKSKGGPPALAKYRKGWGDWVETRERNGRQEARLKTLAEFCELVPALAAYETYFRRTEESLLTELRQVVESRGVKLGGGPGPVTEMVFVSPYGEPVERVAKITKTAHQQLTSGQQLVVALRLGFTSPGMGTAIVSETQLRQFVKTAYLNGADSVAFYNYAEAPRRSIDWIGSVLQEKE